MKKKARRLKIGIPALLAAALLVFFLVRSGRTEVIEYNLNPLTQGPIEDTIAASGTLAPTDTVEIGSQVSGKIVKLHADYNIDEADIGTVQAGQDVRFTVDAVENRTFTSKVQQVRYAAVNTSNVVTYTTIILADNAELLLRPGMTATVTVVTAQAENAFRVLNTALKYHPPTASAETAAEAAKLRGASRRAGAIYVMDDGGQLRVIPVLTGIVSKSTTEISGDQLAAGMKVVTGLKGATTSTANTDNMPMFDGPPPGGGGPPPPGR